MAFWDASALVPLCCAQADSRRSRNLLQETGSIVVWWGTVVEARSAFARLVRETQLTPSELDAAVRSLQQLRTAWSEIQPTEKVRILAEGIPQRYALRALDAMQLAAALVWCRERPAGRSFVCYDERLANAASAAGFNVVG